MIRYVLVVVVMLEKMGILIHQQVNINVIIVVDVELKLEEEKIYFLKKRKNH